MQRERPEYLKHLQSVIFRLHGCQSEHLSTVNVVDLFDGEKQWAGEVEVFALDAYAKAKICYAWSFKGRRQGMDCETVHARLHIPPIHDAKSAVQEAIDNDMLAKQFQLEVEAAREKPWKAHRQGSRVWITGLRGFPIQEPKCHWVKNESADSSDTIAYRFYYELPPDFDLRQTFRRVEHMEPEIPSEVVSVKIVDETGKIFVIPIE
jgi:hypothetical protein